MSESDFIKFEWEKERKEKLRKLQDDAPLQFGPGTFGCHEFLDRISLLQNCLEDWLLKHPSCVLDAEWHALLKRVEEDLVSLYQKVGSKHLTEVDILTPPGSSI